MNATVEMFQKDFTGKNYIWYNICYESYARKMAPCLQEKLILLVQQQCGLQNHLYELDWIFFLRL